MTELEKLDAGLEYCFFDEEVAARKENALRLCAKLNAVDPCDEKAQYEAARDLFGSLGSHVYIQPDFNCDNGSARNSFTVRSTKLELTSATPAASSSLSSRNAEKWSRSRT